MPLQQSMPALHTSNITVATGKQERVDAPTVIMNLNIYLALLVQCTAGGVRVVALQTKHIR
jgi:hypothetical protein